MRPISITLAVLATLFIGPHRAAAIQFLTDNGGGYLLDDQGGRLVLIGNRHTVIINANWGPSGTNINVAAIMDVDDDGTAITIRGLASDNRTPDGTAEIQKTEIETVDSTGKTVVLETCANKSVCAFNLKAANMAPLANDVWFLMTDKAGVRWAATTKMSRPAP